MTGDAVEYVVNSALWATFWLGFGYVIGTFGRRLETIERHLQRIEENERDDT